MDQPTRIEIKLGVTVNLGDFNSIKLEVGVEDRVRTGVDANTNAAIDRVYALVETQLQDKIEKASGKKIVDA